jgi:hypothetical protein
MVCDELILMHTSEVGTSPLSVMFASLDAAKTIVRSHESQSLNFLIVTNNPVHFANTLKTTNIFCALGDFPNSEEARGTLRMQAHMWRQIREVCTNAGVTLFSDGAIRSPILLSVMDVVDVLHEEIRDQLMVYTRALNTILPEDHNGGFEFLPTVRDAMGAEMGERNVLQSPSDYPHRIETSTDLYFLLDGVTSALFPEKDRAKLEWIQSNTFLELTYALQAVQALRTPQGKRKAPPLVQGSQSGERSWGVLLSELLEVSVSDSIKRELSMQVLCACEAVAQQVHATHDPTWIVTSRDVSRSLLNINLSDDSLSCTGSVADSLADDSANDDISLGDGDDECDGSDSSESEWDPRANDSDDASIGLGFGGDNDEAHSNDSSVFDSSSEEEAEDTSSEDEKSVTRPEKRRRKQAVPTQLIESDSEPENDEILLRDEESHPGAESAFEILATMRRIDAQSDTDQPPAFETAPLSPMASPTYSDGVDQINF